MEPLDEESLCRQVCSYLSPLIWDLGHIASFEEAWLVRAVADGGAREGLDELYDAARTPRAARGELALPGRAETLELLQGVRRQALDTLAAQPAGVEDPLLEGDFVYQMVMQHEGQHQETMLQTIDLPADDWRYPAPAGPQGPRSAPAAAIDDAAQLPIPAGEFVMGTDDRSRAYDNERAAHTVEVRAFAIDRYPVSNRRWTEFIAADGYRRTELWSAAGARWLAETRAQAPQGWRRDGETWRCSRWGVRMPVDPAEPVQHVSFYEAEAFARWAGGRLPSEAEWEKAASGSRDPAVSTVYPWGDEAPDAAGLVDGEHGIPAIRSARGPGRLGQSPDLASVFGVEDLLGHVYQWTSSTFAAYPEFKAFPYPEYSEVFFGGPYRVLRGSSWAAHPLLWRNTYRNWDLPQRRQLFAGLRVAYEVR